MIKQPTISAKKIILTILLTGMLALILGCFSQQVANETLHGTKRISDITTKENSESLIFTIKGNQSLTCTAIKQGFPIGIRFDFPDTTMDILKRVYILPGNEIISSIKAEEIVEDKTTTSRLFIALKTDTPYELLPDEAGLQIAFPKVTNHSKDTKPQKKIAGKQLEPKLNQKGMPAATRLKTIAATPLKNYVVVNVQADGAIKDYKSFNLDNPARIVFDMYNIKSPNKNEQIITVESKWIKRIRYFGYQDKVRLVLDAHKGYLSKYSAHPTDTGLLIHVGKISAVPDNASQTFSDDNLGTQQVTFTWDKASKATSYNVYLSSSPGVTKSNGIKISTRKNYLTIKGVKPGTTYYYIVSPVRNLKESKRYTMYSLTIPE